MRPVIRRPVNKSRSARKFRRQVSRTASVNIPRTIMRGGYRL